MISFGFSTSARSPISALIRWITRSQCSHAWILLTNEHSYLGEAWVVEAAAHGVHPVPFSVWEKKNKIVEVLSLPGGLDGEKGLHWAKKQIGKRYDHLGLLMNVWLELGAWFRRTWKNPLQTSSALFCSELCVRFLQKEGYEPALDLDPEGTSPEEFRVWLIKQPGVQFR